MKKVHIITDSASDISQLSADKLDIDVVPIHISIDGVDYVDGLTISNQEFFQKLRTAKVLPKTSAPSPNAFLEVMKKHPVEDEILIMTISSDASATFSSAKLAVEELDRSNVVLFDTRQATLGLLALVHAAVQFRDVGDNAVTIVEKLKEISGRIVVQAAFDDLRYLRMGGRIPFALAVLGSVINMKPIITMQDGKIHSSAKVIGMQRALNHIVYHLADCDVDYSLPAFLGHTDNPEMFNKFTDLIKIHKPDFPLDSEASIGLAVGTHAGPGCVGIVYFTK
ncbi:MAG: DegV family protein [Bacilli bacterium]|jgi:DegV family protein with EDD domain